MGGGDHICIYIYMLIHIFAYTCMYMHIYREICMCCVYCLSNLTIFGLHTYV